MATKNVIVVMLENRSYDNILGYLYGPNNPPGYLTAPPGQTGLQGIPPGATNPNPAGGTAIPAQNQKVPTQIGGSGPPYAPTSIPVIDPKEYFKDMAQQFLGLTGVPGDPPYDPYPPADTSKLMSGFTLNYAAAPGIGQSGAAGNIPDIMNYFTPEQLPVTSFLAKNYAVCDEWFASVPTQTYTNRAFVLTAAPGVQENGDYSFIDDVQYFNILKKPVTLFPTKTVLQQLEGATAGVTDPAWKVYFHDYSIAMDTVAYVQTKGATSTNQNVATFDFSDWPSGQLPKQLGATATTFVQDLAAGKLPTFSFIEPRYFDNYAPTSLPPNCNHPGTAVGLLGGTGASAPIDTATGEVFLMQLYNMLRGDKNWDDMLLVILYDEHGGTYDHVPPPTAVPPGRGIPTVQADSDSAADNFNFTLLGGRIPAIVVSSSIKPGSTIRPGATAFDHSSIVRTLEDLFVAAPGTTSLTDRDQNAPTLYGVTVSPPPTVTAGQFGGQIVCGPMSLAFSSDRTAPQYLLASAGPTIGLTAAVINPRNESWLLPVGFSGSGGPTSLTLEVTVNPSGATSGMHQGLVVITPVGASTPDSLFVPVTLIV